MPRESKSGRPMPICSISSAAAAARAFSFTVADPAAR
jgi:hypothetical protein